MLLARAFSPSAPREPLPWEVSAVLPRPLLFQSERFGRPALIGLLAQCAAIQDLACYDSLLWAA
jgi:hypothetical protein